MKLQLAVATIALSLTSAAFAYTPGNGKTLNTPDGVFTYEFDYTATSPSVAPQFTTTVTSQTSGTVEPNTALAYTHFKAPNGSSNDYSLTTTYSNHASEYVSYFSTSQATGDSGNVYATGVNAGDDMYIVLASVGNKLSAGETHVTYTINSYKS
ncbi:hypothetical protein FNO09_09815 [Salmonella enterica subsp. diarizonae]|nr:hypothetical protein [Salmonella enterica subsp. diarizonae]EDR0254837.1 hypothetical protein [Salmonella enterica subsp. diarizonae]